jgi:uroporphyrinogen decarboxylase
MTNRERVIAILHYKPYDRLPIVHFGYWGETLQKWAAEGHLTQEEANAWGDGNPVDAKICKKLGFDLDWQCFFYPETFLKPYFETKVIKEFPDGSRHVFDALGTVTLQHPGAGSIPAEMDHTLKDRKSWEEHYKWRFQWSEERVTDTPVLVGDKMVPYKQGGFEYLKKWPRDNLYGLHCGSLYGNIRTILGIQNACYLQADDEELFDEIIDTVGDLCYRTTEYVLKSGARFETAHFWEDICFKNGPLISPAVFKAKVGPHYKRITDLLKKYGIDIVSLDCDGMIDALIPTWFENGVNTMFPIEVGTWNASVAPWRKKYGKELRGVGGMNKTVFARDRAAVDAEIERMRPLVEMGGFIPCPDHRIAPDAKWENVKYYCERMNAVFNR